MLYVGCNFRVCVVRLLWGLCFCFIVVLVGEFLMKESYAPHCL
jgi:hypothetical protein